MPFAATWTDLEMIMLSEMNRRQVREAALCMIFDYSFHAEDDGNEQLELYLDNFHDKDEKNISEEQIQTVVGAIKAKRKEV